MFRSLGFGSFEFVSDFVLALRRRLRRESNFGFGCDNAAMG